MQGPYSLTAPRTSADRSATDWSAQLLDALLRHAVRNEGQRRLGLVADRDGRAQRGPATVDAGAITRVDARERLAGLDPVSGLGGDDESDCRIDHVGHRRTSATERDDPAPDGARLHALNETRARRREELALGGLWQQRGIVQHAR